MLHLPEIKIMRNTTITNSRYHEELVKMDITNANVKKNNFTKTVKKY
jgi:hypothetical protein